MSSAPLRAFIAVEIPGEILDRVAEQTAGLRRALGNQIVRWVPAHNIHLTLKFLGDISPANIDILAHMLDAEVSQHQPFQITVGQLGVFPGLRQPRVLWIGVESPPVLKTLQHNIESSTERLGYAAEGRPFSPHLTIGRVHQRASSLENQKIRDILSEVRIGDLGSARVEAVHLFRSDLKPGGAIYTRLHSAFLKNADQT